MALLFDGVSDRVDAPVQLPQTAVTVSLWIRQTTLSDGGVFGSYSPPGDFDRTLQVNADGTVACRIWSTTGDVVTYSSATRVAGEWSHLLYRCGPNAGGQRLVLNGVAVTNPAQVDSQLATRENIRLGGATWFAANGSNMGQKLFAGEIAEAAVWSGELSEAEEVMLGLGCSPLVLTSRLADLSFYRAMISAAAHPGVGVTPTVTGAPVASTHPRVLSPGGAWVYPTISYVTALRGYAVQTQRAIAGAAAGEVAAVSRT